MYSRGVGVWVLRFYIPAHIGRAGCDAYINFRWNNNQDLGRQRVADTAPNLLEILYDSAIGHRLHRRGIVYIRGNKPTILRRGVCVYLCISDVAPYVYFLVESPRIPIVFPDGKGGVMRIRIGDRIMRPPFFGGPND